MNFLNGVVQATGGLSGIPKSAIPTYGAEYQYIIALGAATMVFALWSRTKLLASILPY